MNYKTIKINEETYKKLEEAYEDFKKMKSSLPPMEAKKYGDNFDSFVNQTISLFCKYFGKMGEFQKKLENMLTSLDLSKLTDILGGTSFENIFGLNKNKKENKEETKKVDESKIKN